MDDDETATRLAKIKTALGIEYRRFEYLCKSKDFEGVKDVIDGIARRTDGLSNLCRKDIRLIMAESGLQSTNGL